MNALAIVVACGKEEEVRPGTEAAFLSLGNRPVVSHSLDVFQRLDEIDGIVVVVGKDRTDSMLQLIRRFGYSKICGIVTGSPSRLLSLRTVCSKLPDLASVVLVHEASRPFLSGSVVAEVVKSAKRNGCAVAGHRLPDAVKLATKGKVDSTLPRQAVWTAGTPQAFKREVFEKLLDPKGKGSAKLVDDESEIVRKPAVVRMVESGAFNLKIRSVDDLGLATTYFNAGLVS